MPLNFSSLGFNSEDNAILQDMESAIDKSDTWDWVAKGDPGKWGYFMSPAPEIREIRRHLKMSHTAKTFEAAMTEMQSLALLGIDGYCSTKTLPFPVPSAPKASLVRTKEMDEKVRNEYKTRKAFAKAPKWSADYITAFPDVLRGI
uniref:Uncharacterized protein n=1 Tax=viral metagenome TaxID=1070528 RepID=A0A6C0AJN1_9ZZZZ